MKYTARLSKGFTLIELLIVIALLGALAVGLLATIDPFEQLKKGRDTSLRNTLSEFYNANLRYYSTKAKFPWATDSTFSSTPVGTMTTYVDELVASGELKNRFMELAGETNLNKILVTSTAPEHITVCFRPESKGFQVDPNTVYDEVGSTAGIATCKATVSTGNDCYFCIQ